MIVVVRTGVVRMVLLLQLIHILFILQISVQEQSRYCILLSSLSVVDVYTLVVFVLHPSRNRNISDSSGNYMKFMVSCAGGELADCSKAFSI